MRYLLVIATLVFFQVYSFGQFVTNGSAFSTGANCFTLTPALNNQNGSVWSTSTINLTQSFDLNFTMSFGSNDAGADGNCFILQPAGTGVLGNDGGGMGFEGIPIGFAVEFDSYTNASPNSDPWYDHISFLKNGVMNHASANNLAGPVQANANNSNIEDNANHQVRMVWDAPSMNFSCYFDCNLRLSATIDMVNTIFMGNPIVYYGFAGSTGGLNNLQTVCLPSSVNPLNTPPPICEGGTVTLNAPANASSNIQWEPSNIIANPNAATISAILTSNTTFTVSYSDFCGIPHQYSVLATAVPYPTIIVPPDSVVCDNSAVLLNAQVSGPFTNMIWTSSSGTILSGQTTVNPTVTGAGSYNLSAFNGNCISSEVVNITELFYPVANWSDSIYFCAGQSIILDPLSNATAFNWNSDGSFFPTLTINTGGSYSVTLYNDFCSTTESIIAYEVSPPAISLGEDLLFCEGETAVITSNLIGLWNDNNVSNQITTSNSGSYIQQLNTLGCISADTVNVMFQTPPIITLGNDTTICDGSILNLNAGLNGIWNNGVSASTLPVSSAGNYSVVVNDGICISTDTIVISVAYPPTISLGEDQFLCVGETATITSNLIGLWNTSVVSNQITTNTSGTYYQSSNTLGCIGADSVNITFQFPPIVSLGNDTTICEGTILSLNAGAAGIWNTGDFETQLSVSSPGNYNVVVNDGVCISQDSIDIYMDFEPIDVLPDSMTHCSDLPIVLNAGGNFADTFNWNTLETSSSITPPASGTYTLVASNYCGSRTENIEITYEECEFTLFVPNSFTPNNDGINDVWFPVFDQLDVLNITISDRWGKIIFEGNKQNCSWNGNVGGGDYYAPDGAYAYMILHKSQFGDDQIIFGSIILSR